MNFLIALAVLDAIVGIFLLTQATAGVGIICLGCLIAIMARIAQAAAQHKQLTGAFKQQPSYGEKIPRPADQQRA